MSVVSIKKEFYTMASVDGNAAEITMYGDIVEKQPVDWRGDPIEGSYIIQNEFLEDLNSISNCKDITIRMNSCGGDAGVSVLIHNRLRELADKGTNLTCIVDGVAMSGGSLIMCACDIVKVNPSSLVMIHKCWTFLCGGYNADDLRQQAAQNDAYDKSQVSIYSRKTGLSDAKILHMMSNTTYMTGKEALENGFADELLENSGESNIAASADGKTLFAQYVSRGKIGPCRNMVKTEGNPLEKNKYMNNQEGGRKPMANTIEELRQEYPELISQIEASAAEQSIAAITTAVQEEQRRLQEIDDISALFDDELVREAKYGENSCTAQELTYRAAIRASKQGKGFLTDMYIDASNSGAEGVTASPSDGGDSLNKKSTPDQRMADARAEIKSLFQKKED